MGNEKGGWQKKEDKLTPMAEKSVESVEPLLKDGEGNSDKPSTPKENYEAQNEQDSVRYFSSGSRRGGHPFAAKVGLAVLLLAIIGVVAIVITGINALKKMGEDAPFKTQVEQFLYPVMIYAPHEFESHVGQQQDALLLAASWVVLDADITRQKENNTNKSRYATDDLGRLVVPVVDVENEYKNLFGQDASLFHHSIGEDKSPFTLEYDEKGGYYFIPALAVQSDFTPVVGSIKQEKNMVTIDISFVLSSKIGVDIDGNHVAATEDMADFKQRYIIEKTDDKSSKKWKLNSIKDVEGKRTSAQG